MKKRLIIILLLLISVVITACFGGSDSGGNGNNNPEIPENPDGPLNNEDIIEPGQQMTNSPDWYKDAVFYHLWVKAFNDGEKNDNIGDIRGIINKLDYLNDGNPETGTDLGITAIWLSPIFESSDKKTNPNNIHGYHTTNYYAINDIFGNNKDIKELLDKAHARGIRVIFDFIPNHTSTQHPWFQNAANNGERRDWYVWEENPSDQWYPAWGDGNWEAIWKEIDGYFYYTVFQTPELADLNFHNAEVRAEMKKIAKYWLDRGFDGLRIDAVRYLYENGVREYAEQPETHTFFKELRSEIVDSYEAGGHSKMMMAEAWINGNYTPDVKMDKIATYYGDTVEKNGSFRTDEFHMCLDFDLGWGIMSYLYDTDNQDEQNDADYYDYLLYLQKEKLPVGYTQASFISNHDQFINRPMSAFNNKNKAVMAAALNFLAPTTPIVYYGNEVGLTGDPSGASWPSKDIYMRKDMDWNAVDIQTNDSGSILSWYRYLIKLRNKYEIIRRGTYNIVYQEVNIDEESNPAVFSFMRKYNEKGILVVTNYSTEQVSVDFNMEFEGFVGQKVTSLIGNIEDDKKLIDSISYTVTVPANSFIVYYIGSDADTQERIH